ncbi:MULTISPECIES: hypothetical protein [Ponticoccus]|uniref:Uncharacterized protein n=1 Tax=Ponticoccus litoralis TaxID=422297 RepID=A0AAW9SMM6_9RHOB
MMITLIAFSILAGSALVAVGSLRMVTRDTLSVVTGCTTRARASGTLHRRLAFVALWFLIFGLSYTV